MRLTDNFTLAELTASQTATRRGIRNTPNAAQIAALRALCVHILEPLRAHFGRPVRVSSGFRSRRLNRAIGGAEGGQHPLGEAADIEIPGVDNRRVAKWIEANLPFDQLILEGAKRDDPNAGWIHVSYGPRHRRDVLTATFPGPKYTKGIAA